MKKILEILWIGGSALMPRSFSTFVPEIRQIPKIPKQSQSKLDRAHRTRRTG